MSGPMTEPREALVASNPAHQQRLDEYIEKGTAWRCPCGSPMFAEDECAVCYGDDPYGSSFCPVEDYCCGC